MVREFIATELLVIGLKLLPVGTPYRLEIAASICSLLDHKYKRLEGKKNGRR